MGQSKPEGQENEYTLGYTRNMNFGQGKRSAATVRRSHAITETLHNGEDGRNGRPRVKEEVIMPPQYDQIDLFDSNEEIRFQGEIAKYKACINPAFMPRWIQVTDTALRYFKGRCNALSCCNRPLMAIPIEAI